MTVGKDPAKVFRENLLKRGSVVPHVHVVPRLIQSPYGLLIVREFRFVRAATLHWALRE
jgi:hypothetical protein